MTKLIGAFGVLAVFTLSLNGCSSDSKPTQEAPAAPKYPDLGAFCAAIGNAECSDSILTSCGVPDKTTCAGAVQATCVSGTGDVTFGRNTGNYQPSKGDACVAAVQAAYADAKVTAAEYGTLRAACDLAFSALRPVGYECSIDADCDITSGLICTVAGSKKKCAAPGTKGKGDDCTQAACMPPLVCGPSNFCVSGRDQGSPCTAVSDPCSAGLLCENSVCVARHGTNTSCLANEECASGFCARVPDISNPMMLNPNARLCEEALVYGTGAPLCQNFFQK